MLSSLHRLLTLGWEGFTPKRRHFTISATQRDTLYRPLARAARREVPLAPVYGLKDKKRIRVQITIAV